MLPEFLFNAHNPDFNLRRIVNTNLVVITLKAAWDAYQTKQTMTTQQYRDDIRRRLAMYITNEIKLLPCHLDNAHKHAMITRPNTRPRRMYTEREKMLLRRPSPRPQSLSGGDITAYRDTYLATDRADNDRRRWEVDCGLHHPPATTIANRDNS